MLLENRHVAVVVDTRRSFDRRVVKGIATFLQRSPTNWSLHIEDDAQAMSCTSEWNADGIIANLDDRNVAQAISLLDIPVVGIGEGHGYCDKDSAFSHVATDEENLSRIAFQHFYELGLRRFAFYGEQPSQLHSRANARAAAFRNCATEAGCECEMLGVQPRSRQLKAARLDLQSWLKTLTPSVGLMAANDSLARNVLEACETIGIRVPHDIAVIGVDNDSVMCHLAIPSLTSIEQGAHGIGVAAAQLLDDLVYGATEKRFVVLSSGTLIARQSTDVLAMADEEVLRAVEFIRSHACDPIQVQHVLAKVPVSRSTLENRFRSTLGRSIHAEILRVRMETAKKLLGLTNLPIVAVSRHVGVSNVQYFTTLVRQTTGLTPAKFRISVRKSMGNIEDRHDAE